MFAFPLFSKLRELNKTRKFRGANIDNIPTLIGIVCCLKIVWFEFTKIYGAKINLHVKSKYLLRRGSGVHGRARFSRLLTFYPVADTNSILRRRNRFFCGDI